MTKNTHVFDSSGVEYANLTALLLRRPLRSTRNGFLGGKLAPEHRQRYLEIEQEEYVRTAEPEAKHRYIMGRVYSGPVHQ